MPTWIVEEEFGVFYGCLGGGFVHARVWGIVWVHGILVDPSQCGVCCGGKVPGSTMTALTSCVRVRVLYCG